MHLIFEINEPVINCVFRKHLMPHANYWLGDKDQEKFSRRSVWLSNISVLEYSVPFLMKTNKTLVMYGTKTQCRYCINKIQL